MSRDFDPVRAAAGEPIQFCLTGGVWKDVRYVGKSQLGVVIEDLSGGNFTCTANIMLRMKPMPTKKWVLEFDSPGHAQAAQAVLLACGKKWVVPEVTTREIPPTE